MDSQSEEAGEGVRTKRSGARPEPTRVTTCTYARRVSFAS